MRNLAVYVNFINEAYRRQITSAAAGRGFGVTYYDSTVDTDAFAADIGDYEIIYGHPAPALLKRAKNLRWLCSDFAGIEGYLDESVWPNPWCLLSNSSGAYGPTISEHIVMVLLMLLRRMPEYIPAMADRSGPTIRPSAPS